MILIIMFVYIQVQQQNSVLDVKTGTGPTSREISPDPDAPPLPPPFNPDYAESAQHPIYNEIHNCLPPQSHSESQNPPVPSHVYQDISELSSRARETPIQEHTQRDVQHGSVDNAKPIPVYQEIGEVCRARARGPPAPSSNSQPDNGHSSALELLSVLEIDAAATNSASAPPLPPRYPVSSNGEIDAAATNSASAPPLPPRYPVSSNGATPPLHVSPRCPKPQNGQLSVGVNIEADQCTGGRSADNSILSCSPSPESLPDHPKTLLPNYDDVASMAKSNGTLGLSELSIVVESDSTNSDIPYTPEPLPTPVYEDITEATSGVREGVSSSAYLQSPSPEHLSLHQSSEVLEDDDEVVVGEFPLIPSGGTLV